MENAHPETNSPEKRKLKKRRQPENLGSFAVVSERAKPAPDRIGHVLMAGESEPEKKETAPPAELLLGRRIETISRNELLELSERVTIDGTSLHQIYETHLVGERGLRRLMAEYQHDGDLEKALRQEIVEREIDFERDPAMRDIAAYEAGTASKDDSPTTLNKLLEQAGEAAGDDNEETAFFKARARYEAQELHQHKQRRRAVDISLALVIIILLALVILLSMKRG